MRRTFIYSLGLALTLALASQASAQTNTSRSGGIVGKVKVDETSRLDVVRSELQTPLNSFVGNQTKKIEQIQISLDTWGTGIQEVCVLMLQKLEAGGATIPVTVSVPALGVNLPPNELEAFCDSVIAIDLPAGGTPLATTPPFATNKVPPVCNPANQDLAWNGSNWSCVNTLSGVCAQPGATPPTWAPVQ